MHSPTLIQKPIRKPIPAVQGEYLRFVRDFHKKHRISPSLGELVTASGDTKSTVRTTVKALIRKGYLTTAPQRARNLLVTQQGHKVLRAK